MNLIDKLVKQRLEVCKDNCMETEVILPKGMKEEEIPEEINTL